MIILRMLKIFLLILAAFIVGVLEVLLDLVTLGFYLRHMGKDNTRLLHQHIVDYLLDQKI